MLERIQARIDLENKYKKRGPRQELQYFYTERMREIDEMPWIFNWLPGASIGWKLAELIEGETPSGLPIDREKYASSILFEAAMTFVIGGAGGYFGKRLWGVIKAPLKKATPSVGAHSRVRGHHIHQGASYGLGEARKTNPNYAKGISIKHGPGFSREQHRLADAVQRNVNRAAHGKTVNQPDIGLPGEPPRVQITVTGEGTLAPTANQWFEDIKAFYSIRAAKPRGFSTPDRALDLVNRSASQLEATGTAPVRVPTR